MKCRRWGKGTLLEKQEVELNEGVCYEWVFRGLSCDKRLWLLLIQQGAEESGWAVYLYGVC